MTSDSDSARPFLSLCMIVKNESKHLARCLESARPYVDEIVVVDTGSQDDTVAIATRYGAQIDYFAWCDDFSAARNYALSKVSGEWMLMLDADEELVVGIPDLCSALGARQDVLAYALSFNDVNVPPEAFSGGSHLRLWRNLPGLQYHNRYHEQLRYHGDRPIVYDHLPGVSILHYGNSDAAALRQKTIARDIPILESIRQTEGLNFWLLDCLARNYQRTDQLGQAQACYEEAMERLLPHLMSGEPPEPFYWVPTLMHYLAMQSLEANDFETARLLCQRGLEWCPSHLPLNDLAGYMLLELGFPLGAIAYFNQCLHLAQTNGFYSTEPFERTLLDLDPLCRLGCAYMAMKDWQSAITAFEQALTIDPGWAIAQQNLDHIRQSL